MNSTLKNQILSGWNRSAKIIFLLCSFLILNGVAYCETPDSAKIKTQSSDLMLKKPMTAADSVTKAKEQAAEAADLQRKETINLVLTVIGSVVAIVLLLFLTWKMSSGSGKPAPPKTTSGQGNSSSNATRTAK
jgi:hypothetical protein